jgi:uncharacterized protein YicC (UPF0701 family)
MTGFGTGEVVLPQGRVVAEIRSVNQRFLDIRARLPRELAELCLFAEQVARERLRRGRVELAVHIEGTVFAPSTLDRERARAAFAALCELRDELAPSAPVPLSLLAVVPDLFGPPPGPALATLRESVRLAVDRAIDAMESMCRREGETLSSDLAARSATIRRLLGEVAQIAEGSREAIRKRLRERLTRLLGDDRPPLDDSRVEAEIVLFAERSDVTEELTRLGSHAEQFDAVLGANEPEPVGRRLDFLLQEMLRETNTLGAKAQDAALSHRVVAIKVELERLREQVQNIE